MHEQILEKHRDAPLRVYAVWYAMYRGDAREQWRPGLLSDPRAVHWWDERRLVGREMLDYVQTVRDLRAPRSREFQGSILWDAYLLFDPNARWDRAPKGLVSWGYTILSARDALKERVSALLRVRRGR